MTIAYDAQTRFDGTGDLTGTHTPVGTPRAVLALIDSIDSADHVVGVTYGGVALTELPLSPQIVTGVGNNHVIYAYLLGTGIPTGAQTFFVDTNATIGSGIHATCITMTAAADVELQDTSTAWTNGSPLSNPTVALTIAAINSFCIGLVASALTAANIAPGASFTQIDEYAPSTGTVNLEYRTTNPTANTTLDWVGGSANYAIFGVALSERAGISRDLAAKVSTADNAKQGLVLQFR